MTRIDHNYLTARLEALSAAEGVTACTCLTHSILGREIPLVRLGKGKRSIVLIGAQQGSEGATAGILLDFIADYCKQYEKNATPYEHSMEYLWRERSIYILPMLNPDGVAYATAGVEEENPLYRRVLAMNGGCEAFDDWDANARGVDLSHNFSTGFAKFRQSEQARAILNGAPRHYSGEYPESEPETAALGRFLRAVQGDLKGLLLLRGGGERIECSCENGQTAKCMAVGRVLSRTVGYRLTPPEDAVATGSVSDWCLSALGRPAYSIFCGQASASGDAYRASLYERLRRALFSFAFWV